MKLFVTTVLFLLLFCIGHTQNYVLTFDGNNDYVNLGSNAGNDIRSIELWFNPSYDITSTNPERKALLIRNADIGEDEYGIYIGHDFLEEQGRITFSRNIDSVFYYVYSNENSWEGNNWVHVAVTIDSVQGIKMFINGVLQNDTDTIKSAIPNRPEETMLGCWGDKYIRWFDGSIDEVRFWRRTLNADEIIEHMCDTLFNHHSDGLWGYWDMNEGSGSTLVNYGEEGTNGSIEGCVYQRDTLCPSYSLGELNLINSVHFYPNPIIDKSVLKFPESNLLTGRLQIYDQTGKVVDNIQFINTSSVEVQRNSLGPGLYYYIVTTEEFIFTGKIVFAGY